MHSSLIWRKATVVDAVLAAPARSVIVAVTVRVAVPLWVE